MHNRLDLHVSANANVAFHVYGGNAKALYWSVNCDPKPLSPQFYVHIKMPENTGVNKKDCHELFLGQCLWPPRGRPHSVSTVIFLKRASALAQCLLPHHIHSKRTSKEHSFKLRTPLHCLLWNYFGWSCRQWESRDGMFNWIKFQSSGRKLLLCFHELCCFDLWWFRWGKRGLQVHCELSTAMAAELGNIDLTGNVFVKILSSLFLYRKRGPSGRSNIDIWFHFRNFAQLVCTTVNT